MVQSSADVKVSVTTSGLIAHVINGYDRSIKVGQTLLLDASASRDPDIPLYSSFEENVEEEDDITEKEKTTGDDKS